MRVLFLTTHLNAGGITSYLLTLSKGLLQEGHEVFVGSSGGNMEAEFETLGVRLFPLKIKTKSEVSLKVFFAIPKVMRFVKENKIDIIHAHTRITQVLANWISVFQKIPYVATCHGFFKTRWTRKLFPCWGNKSIAISVAVKDHLHQDFQIKDKNIRIIHNAIDVERFPLILKKDRIEEQSKLDLQWPVVGIIARLSDVKGQDILVQAMPGILKRFPKAQLLLVGEGKFERALKDWVECLRVEESVRFYPVVNKVLDFLKLMDVFVMPSRMEGFGISVLEAQACGIPVVASNVGGLPNIIQQGETGLLVEKENPNALADAICDLLEDKEMAKMLAQKGRTFVLENYSLIKMAKETETVYRELVKE